MLLRRALILHCSLSRAAAAEAPLSDVIDLVVAWLPDKTPLAATARFARCASHFRGYLVASEAWVSYVCCSCGAEISCVVEGHDHHAGRSSTYVSYRGREAGAGYVWEPESGCVACLSCVERLGYSSLAWLREWDDSVREEPRCSSPISPSWEVLDEIQRL